MSAEVVLADTSVWVDHFRNGNRKLAGLLNNDTIACHPFIIGELACGNLKNRNEILTLLHSLEMINTAENAEVLHFIEKHGLMGKGLGLIDMHLLSSALIGNALLWTLDKKLHNEAKRLTCDFTMSAI